MRAIWGIAVIFTAALAAPAVAGGGDEGILPPERYLEVWRRDGEVRVYAAEELYDHIDGGAEAFLELGFEACTVGRYLRGGGAFVIEVYRMTDPAAALGSYWTACGRETPDPGLPARHSVGSNQLLLVKGRRLLKVTAWDESAKARDALLEMGRYCAERIPEEEAPDLLTPLPPEGRVEGSVRLLRGPYALQSFAFLGEGNVLLLDARAQGVSARYESEGGGTRSLLVVEYPSEECAARALEHLRGNLDSYIRVAESSEAGFRFADHAGRPGEVSRAGSRVTVSIGP